MLKIKRKNLSQIKQQLTYANDVKNTKLALMLVDNHEIVDVELKKLTDEVSIGGIDESHKDYNEIAEFENHMKDTYPKFCKQNQGGGLQLVDGKGWSEELAKLKIKYPAGARYFEENESRINGLLNQDLDLDLKTIDEKDLPSDLSVNDLNKLSIIINQPKVII